MPFLRKTCRDYVQTQGINQTTSLLNSGNTIVCSNLQADMYGNYHDNVWTMKVRID